MSPKPEDYIEKLFQEASQNYDIPFNEQDWQNMEQKLKGLPKAVSSKSGWKSKYYVFAGALLFTVLSVYLAFEGTLSFSSKQNIKRDVENIYKNESSSILMGANYKHTEKESPGSAKPLVSKPSTENSLLNQDSFTGSVPPVSNQVGDKNHESREAFLIAEDPQDEKRIQEHIEILRIQPKGLTTDVKEIPSLDYELAKKYIGSKPEVYQKQKDEKGLERFKIRVSFSPDFSATRWPAFDKPGALLGAGLDYAISNRLYVQSGLIWSRKVYKTAGDEYTAPADFWYYNASPEYALGQCAVMEIPINLRYDIITKPKHKIFISSGLSSYVMLSEDYEFFYKENYYQPTMYSIQNSGTHFMSIFNVSFGVEYWLNPELAVQAEPLARIPLEGIGYGKVNLLTKGLNISFVWKPFAKKSSIKN